MPKPLDGLGFFPGGYGLWGCESGHPLPKFPAGGIMVVGHDFHSEMGYRKSVSRGGESLSQPTWRNLLSLVREVGLPLERCFFTNFYMGLRAGSSATGKFPGRTDERFVSHCEMFFLEQLRSQAPALILTLGMEVPSLIGHLSPQLRDWTRGRGVLYLDAVGPMRTGVTFDDIADYSTTVAALIHPSLRHASICFRSYRQRQGHSAEVAMLEDASSDRRFELRGIR